MMNEFITSLPKTQNEYFLNFRFPVDDNYKDCVDQK